MIRAKMIQKLLGVFLIILAIAVSIEASSSDCPNPNVPNCKKSELLCISAPEPEDHCSKLECIKKKYQSPMNPSKKCKAFCPLYCGENHVTCPGPMDENVRNSNSYFPNSDLSNVSIYFLGMFFRRCLCCQDTLSRTKL